MAVLKKLTIRNYALIDQLQVSFSPGFTVITGETGAGKSILLDGLFLVLGNRADLSALRDKSEKCVIEAEFEVSRYGLEAYYKDNDIDYEPLTILRREIQPSGKSRAFINDSPVTLDMMTGLGDRLIDVHSQHQTLQLTEGDFQMKVIDALAENGPLLKEYSQALVAYRKTQKELDGLIDRQKRSAQEQDYNVYLLEELQRTPLRPGLLAELEERSEALDNVERISGNLALGNRLMRDEDVGIMAQLGELRQALAKLEGFGKKYEELSQRIQSSFIELDDISGELETLYGNLETDPGVLEEVNSQLQTLHDLMKKHGVAGVEELIEVRDRLETKVEAIADIAETIAAKEMEIERQHKTLEDLAMRLRSNRDRVIPELKKQLEGNLHTLGMPNARFEIVLVPETEFNAMGKDGLSFLFSANKGTAFGTLKKTASGGELSRIMLVIKAILGEYENLPTMMFDEIDTGVSGEISNRMGEIMKEMSRTMQVFAITHLPQVASKGDWHFKVYKEEIGNRTQTRMRLLDKDDRVKELAEMIGGKSLTASALAHARQLLD